jgi:hypothetical protein
VHRNAKALIDVDVTSVVGSGESVKFWSDRWLLGKTVAEHCPTLIQMISRRALKRRIVAECWGLVLKYYELRTRQHKMLNVNSLHPSKHYFP